MRSVTYSSPNLQIVFQDPYSSMNPRMLVGHIIEEGIKALDVIPDAQARKQRVLELLEQVDWTGMPIFAIHMNFPGASASASASRVPWR